MITIIVQILFCVLNNKTFTTLHLKVWVNYSIPLNQLTGTRVYIQALILLYSSGLKQNMSINQTLKIIKIPINWIGLTIKNDVNDANT